MRPRVTRVDAAPRAAGGAARLCLGCEALRRLGCAGFGTWLALSGCAAGPDFKPPPAPSALQYTDTADSAAPSGGAELQHIAWGRDIEGSWWELFRSQPIDAIVKQAIDHNYSLAASTATLAESSANIIAGCRDRSARRRAQPENAPRARRR